MTDTAITAENSTNSTNKPTVLVTGGTGFIGSWAIVELLRQGYYVRATLRSLAQEAKLRAALATQTDPTNRLTFFVADLLQDEGWDQAMAGAEWVLHIASPLGVGASKEVDLITTSREGTLRVLKAGLKAGVKRVVVTSSGVAALPLTGQRQPAGNAQIDESSWTDLTVKGVETYTQAKTLAERAAWDLIARAGGITSLTTILPVMVQGPVLSADFAKGSVEVVGRMLSGKLPALPNVGFSIVDVRDVVDLHIKAMTAPQAAGQRLVASAEFLWMRDIAAILQEHFGSRLTKIPTRQMPDLMLRLAALFNSEARQLVPRLGQRRDFTSTKAANLLDWHPRPATQAIIDGAESLLHEGLV